MYLYMPSVLGALQFIQSQKAALAICCFDWTTEFQPGMLNSTALFRPVVSLTRDIGQSFLVTACNRSHSLFSSKHTICLNLWLFCFIVTFTSRYSKKPSKSKFNFRPSSVHSGWHLSHSCTLGFLRPSSL